MPAAPSSQAAEPETAFLPNAGGAALSAAHAAPYARLGKRGLDLVLVLASAPAALALALPIAAWNLVAFRDLRRVFFVQRRVGRAGREFRMLKFRTMKDAPAGATASWFSGGDAARVTRFGRFLRNSHLDELPQLVNVLRGDMHIVGPRPEMPDVHRWACGEVEGFARRLAVRPGLTGLAQVTQGYTGASVECYEEKLSIDLAYLDGLSLRGDVGVILRTVPWVLRGRGWRWQQKGAAPARPAALPGAVVTAAAPARVATPEPAPCAVSPGADAASAPARRDLVEAKR